MKRKFLQITALIAAFLFVANLGFSQSKEIIGPTLYEQVSGFDVSQYPSYKESQKITNIANKDRTSQLADDFTVPTGETWNIATVKVFGYYPTWPATVPMDSVNVFIYENKDTNDVYDNPGDALHSFTTLTADNLANTAHFDQYGNPKIDEVNITLPSTVSLTEGKYWISVQAIRDYALDGSYSIYTHHDGTTTYGDATMGKNPLNGNYWNAPDWTSMEVFNSWAKSYNLCFGLYAERVANDINLISINSPASGPEMTATEAVSITLENPGTADQSNFDVAFTLDGGTTWESETITDVLVGGGSMDYTFTATADLSVAADYTLTVKVELTGDENTSNDEQTIEITNFGVVIIFGEEESVTVCDAYFSDPSGPADWWVGPVVADTMTIYPDGENLRARLIFTEFDNSWGQVWIYDGETVDAPAIDLTPDNPNTEYAYDVTIMDTVTASNATGALTVYWSGSNSGTKPGWLANIECYAPPADNFGLYDIAVDKQIMYDIDDITVSAIVRNDGITTQAKTVTFLVNDVEIGTATTSDLGPAEYDTLSVVWSPAETGLAVIQATIVDDDDNSDNSIEIERVVYGEGFLIESFEEEMFPPKGWTSLGGSSQMTSNWDIGQHLTTFLSIMGADTLVTPRLVLAEGDAISFLAYNNNWWGSAMDIFWGETPEGPWNLIANVPMPYGSFTEDFTYEIPAEAAGNNYIAFGTLGDPFWATECYLDFVRGPLVYKDDNDLWAKDLEGRVLVSQYDTVTYTVSVENYGLLDVASTDYSVSFYQEIEEGDDILVGTLDGIDVEKSKTVEFDFEFSFIDAVSYRLYADVDFENDGNTDDNRIYSQLIYAVPFGTEIDTVGEFVQDMNGYPVNGSGDYSLSQTMYYQEELGEAGAIIALSYDYKNNQIFDLHTPVEIYMMETEDTSLWAYDEVTDWGTYPRGNFKPVSDFTLMYNDSLEFIGGGNSHTIRIPLDEPFIYSGDKNIIVMFYRKATEDYFSVSFAGSYDGLPTHFRSMKAGQYYDPIDLEDTTLTNALGKNYLGDELPVTTFYKNTSSLGEIAGNVYHYADSTAFEGVPVTYSSQTVVTDVDGYYKLALIPEGDAVTYYATYFGYRDNIATVEVTQGFQTINDLYMELKPQVVVIGNVVNSDYEAPVVGLDVTLEGYDNYAVVTDANGDFAIDDVYANETYTLSMMLEHYEAYVDENVVTTEAIDTLNLGTITLQEVFTPAFLVSVEEATDLTVSWNKPHTAVDSVIEIYDDLLITNTYQADIQEEVMLGNMYEVGGEGTITAIDVWFLDNATGGDSDVTIRIFDENEELISESEAFLPVGGDYYEDQFSDYMSTIDVPDVAYSGTFYVMVSWLGDDALTDWLCFDRGYGDYPTPDVAVYKYPNESAQSFSGTFGSYGMFSMNVQILAEDGTKLSTDKSIDGYNVYRGLTSEMNDFANWTMLANVESSDDVVSYVDATWPPAEAGFYSYAVEAIYTEEIAVPSFSTTNDNGVFGSVNLTVTSNIAATPNAHVMFVNQDNGFYSYESVLGDNGLWTVDIAQGTYNVSAFLPGHEPYYSIVTLEETNDLAIEMQELIIPPHTLEAVVNDNTQQVELSWEFGNLTNYAYDNGVVLSGFSINAGGEAWLGNLFPVLDAGNIISIEVFGISQGQNGYELEIDFYNAAQEYMGSSSTFEFDDEDWTTVSVPNIPFDGAFYAMVHWNEDVNTDAVGITNEYESYGYYYGPLDGEEGNHWVAMEEIGGEPGIFLLRANVNVTGKGVTTIDPQNMDNLAKNATVNTLEEVSVEAPYKPAYADSKTFQSFNVYVDGDVVATGVTENTYVLTNVDLTTDGEHEAGVAAVFISENSEMATNNFLYGGVNTDAAVTVKSTGDVLIANALVKLTNTADASITYAGFTNAFGIATITGIQKGMYTAEVSHGDYATVNFNDVDLTMEAATVEFAIWPTSSLNVSGENGLTAFPNPTKDHTVVNNASGSMLSIYNAAGILMEIVEVTSDAQRIDLSSYDAGSYILKVQNDEEIVNLKLNVIK